LAKQGEIEYLARGGASTIEHARGKPFTDEGCGFLLADLGGVMSRLPPPPARILDLGCGSGWTSVMLARRGYEVVGQDIAGDMVALAEANRAAAGVSNLRFVVADYEAFDADGSFDGALFYDSLHHAVDPAAAMATAFRALRPGGVLVTVEPGHGHARSAAALAAVQAFDVTERDMPPSLVRTLGLAAGFRDASVFPTPRTLLSLHLAQAGRGAALRAWLAQGWLTFVRGHRHGALVVLRK
jgi:SAM-dependent methyltransferase